MTDDEDDYEPGFPEEGTGTIDLKAKLAEIIGHDIACEEKVAKIISVFKEWGKKRTEYVADNYDLDGVDVLFFCGFDDALEEMKKEFEKL